jgi:hypothetical protein
MSALGQKQTFALQNVMSALPPKADMCGTLAHVRFVLVADIAPGGLFQNKAVRNAGAQRTRCDSVFAETTGR